MKERPILFQAPMVRAEREGRKTKTRRTRGLEKINQVPSRYVLVWLENDFHPLAHAIFRNVETGDQIEVKCPYGRVGDSLWVREQWAVSGIYDTLPPSKINPGGKPNWCGIYYAATKKGIGLKWRPSIHMPRWASRTLLEITDIRLERLQDLTNEDAIAEGVFFTDYGRQCFHDLGDGSPPRKYDPATCPAPIEHHPQYPGQMWDKTTSHEECLTDQRNAFFNLWIKINGEASFAASPWVWVITFRRIEQDEARSAA